VLLATTTLTALPLLFLAMVTALELFRMAFLLPKSGVLLAVSRVELGGTV
jgi:hypothetical protein